MKQKKIIKQIERIIKALKNEKNYLLKFNYVLKNTNRDEIEKILHNHIKVKQRGSIIGKMEENNDVFTEVTIFEILSELPKQRIEIPMLRGPITKLEYLDKHTLFIQILPIIDGTEAEPLLILF